MNYLLDTNALVYYFNGLTVENKLHEIIASSFQISIISKIEFLGWSQFAHNKELFTKARSFIHFARVYPLTNTLAEATILLRQQQRIKVPDAIIAATALVYDLTLVTHNTKDFKNLGVNLHPLILL